MHLLFPGVFIFMARYKFFIGFLLSGALLFALLGAVSFLGQDYNAREGIIRATLLAAGQEYEAWLPEGSTAYDLLISAAENSEFEFRGKNFWGLGFFVEEINGLAQNPKEDMYWIYYINGEKALVGVSQYTIQPNNSIEWKYESEQ